jgi:NitT/TauT family transport system permease protein
MRKFWEGSSRGRMIFAMIVILLVIWEVLIDVLKVRIFLMAPPSKVFMEFVRYPMFFLTETLYTLWTTLAGFVIALVLGVGFGIAIVYSRLLENTLYTFLVAFNAVPKVALAPLFVIWLGTGSEPKIAIAMLIAIFPILIDTVLGLKSVDPEMLNMARAGHSTRLAILWKIRLPSALPSIFSGMKVAISFALVGAIVGEFVAGDTGLGHVIVVAQGAFDTARVFVALVLLGVLGTILFNAVEMLEKLLVPWHVSQRSGHDDGPAVAHI